MRQRNFTSFCWSKFFLIGVLFLFVLTGCGSTHESRSPSHVDKSDQLSSQPIQEIQIKPGRVTLLSFPFPQQLTGAKLYCNGERKLYFVHEGVAKAYLSESYFSPLGNYTCELKNKNFTTSVAKVEIQDFQYPEEVLTVDPKKVILSDEDLARVAKERDELSRVFKRSSPVPLFKGPFSPPLDSFITSHYGTRRVFNNMRKGQHLGTDFRAKVGVPIQISNSGRVVFTGHHFFSGKTVIIDHGVGVFTIYSHLSKIMAKVGRNLQKGDVIGLSGATGRISGPHLHWGVRVQGQSVDGFSLIEAGL